MKKALAGMALLLAAFCVQAKDASELRFGVDPTYVPFESKAPLGQLVGFEIDLGNEICKRLAVKCVWVETGFDGIIPALQGRKFDAILSAMSITLKREEQVAFSVPLFNTPSRLIGKEGVDIKPTVVSLTGKKVGVAQGSTQEAYAKANWAPAGIEVVSYANQEQVFTDLLVGRIDVTLTDMIAPAARDFSRHRKARVLRLLETRDRSEDLGQGRRYWCAQGRYRVADETRPRDQFHEEGRNLSKSQAALFRFRYFGELKMYDRARGEIARSVGKSVRVV